MDYGLMIQHNRNEMIRDIAEKNQCTIVETNPVHYMDLRPYIYSSTISEFEVSYVDEMLMAIHFNKLPSTIFLGDSPKNGARIKVLLDRVPSYDKLPIMIATQGSLTNPETLMNQKAVNSAFKVKNIITAEDLVLWCKVLAEGLFDNPYMGLDHMLKLFAHALKDERYRVTLGTINGTPVSAGIGYISKLDDQSSMGGIYMITTVKAYRGCGYGSKLTYELSRALLEQGVVFTMLDASEMGASLYYKMGYKSVGHSYRFFPNETVSE